MSEMRMPMQRKIRWVETIDESTSVTETHFFNWARTFSGQNRRALHQVDSKGNCLMYVVAIKQTSPEHVGNSQVTSVISTANSGYVTKQAVKAWHRARDGMLRREGISKRQLGKYRKNMRFPLTTADAYQSDLHTGEWTDTSFAVEAPQDTDDASGGLTSADMVDTYTLTLTGASVKESPAQGETQYSTVGIIDSWLDARRAPDGTSTDDTVSIDHEENPLYNIRSGSMASEEVLEIVQDAQVENPPYNAAASGFTGLFAQGSLSSAVNVVDAIVVECPAGLMAATITSSDSDDEVLTDAKVAWDIELIDVYPM